VVLPGPPGQRRQPELLIQSCREHLSALRLSDTEWKRSFYADGNVGGDPGGVERAAAALLARGARMLWSESGARSDRVLETTGGRVMPLVEASQ